MLLGSLLWACSSSGNVDADGLTSQRAALDCTEFCLRAVAAGCTNGYSTFHGCLEGCDEGVAASCPVQPLFDCLGPEPELECDTDGSVLAASCSSQLEAVESCTNLDRSTTGGAGGTTGT